MIGELTRAHLGADVAQCRRWAGVTARGAGRARQAHMKARRPGVSVQHAHRGSSLAKATDSTKNL